jgi:DNA-binding response OmpR family regulator
MPGLDGYRVLRTLRDEGNTTPVLILSAKGEEADKVRGFRMGADDFVTKPFSLLELLARVEALLRRSKADTQAQAGETFVFGDVHIDAASRQVTRNDVPVELTDRELSLLISLARRRGAVASRQELLLEVWGHRGRVLSRTVDTHMAELRRKLEQDPASPRYLVTVRKRGYRLQS